MIRIPTVREIADLFADPRDVDDAVALISRTTKRVSAVAQRAEKRAKAEADAEQRALAEAQRRAEESARQLAEAERAFRVAGRLNELTA